MTVTNDAPLTVWAADAMRQELATLGVYVSLIQKALLRLDIVADALAKGVRPPRV